MILELKNVIKSRTETLNEISAELKKQLKHAPEGRLRISKGDSGEKYYHMTENGGKNGKYIRNEDHKLIQQLAQKGYAEQMLKLVDEEYNYLKVCQAKYPKKTFEDYYDSLSKSRQSLICPVWVSDEEYIKEWLSQEYQRLDFKSTDFSQFYTKSGIRVRSKAEVIIANTLEAHGLPFLVELPLYLEGLGIINPDFTILDIRNREIKIWEHHGMMDDKYYLENNFLLKNTAYIANGFIPGINLIQTFESQKVPLSIPLIETIINTMFFGAKN